MPSPKPKKAGRSIQMPSASLWLGYYVTTRPRADGTFRVLFEIPARLRPSGWPSQIPLPREGERTGNLADAIEVYRIQQDAKALYEALQATKGGNKEASLPAAITRKGTVPWLIRKWGGQTLLDAVQRKVRTIDASVEPGAPYNPNTNPSGGREEWYALEPRTRQLYIRSLRPVFAWSITLGHRHVRQMRPDEVAAFLDMWTPGQRKNVRAMLSQLFSIAQELGEIGDATPLDKVKIKKRKRVKGGRRKSAVTRWSREDVELYAETARTAVVFRDGRGGRDPRPWKGGAIMVRMMYETAADSTDVITWTREHLTQRYGVDGVEFDRGKTGVPAFVPISSSLAQEIREAGALYLVTDPFGRPYQPVLDDARLRGHLTTLREQVVKREGPKLTFDHLRHSAATEAVERGFSLDDVAHLTAHKDGGMNREVYVQRSAPKTIEIQRARGIIT